MFRLLPAPVLLYVLSNLDVTMVAQSLGQNTYIFLGAVVELLRPYFLTVTNVTYWAGNTVESFRQSLVRIINVIRAEDTRVRRTPNLASRISFVLSQARQAFSSSYEGILDAMRRDFSQITLRRV